jgi:outer membrane protein TolC
MSVSARSLVSLLALSFPACVGYRPASVSAPEAERSLAPLPAGPLAFEEALRLLVERNPDLRALRAEAGAVNLAPGPQDLEISQEIRDGNATDFWVGTDILSLFGIGPRSAEKALARAMREEALRRHHERARELAADLASAWAVERTLAGIEPPTVETGAEEFRAAGLISEADIGSARALVETAAAEGRRIDLDRREARREIARLLGAGPEAEVVPLDPGGGWPPLPAPEARDLLFARGDLQRLAAEFETADRRLRLAVARQWPNLGIFLGRDFDLSDPMGMVEVRLPLAAPAEARAAVCAREAARRRFEAGVLAALHEAASARNRLEAAEAEAHAVWARRQASAALVKATRARLQVEADAITDLILVAADEVDSSRDLREAETERARLLVEAARASGWPGPRIGGLR